MRYGASFPSRRSTEAASDAVPHAVCRPPDTKSRLGDRASSGGVPKARRVARLWDGACDAARGKGRYKSCWHGACRQGQPAGGAAMQKSRGSVAEARVPHSRYCTRHPPNVADAAICGRHRRDARRRLGHVRGRGHGRREDLDRTDAVRNPNDLYFVWRDYGYMQDRNRGTLPGKDIVELKTQEA